MTYFGLQVDAMTQPMRAQDELVTYIGKRDDVNGAG